jgi:hypothetical protein
MQLSARQIFNLIGNTPSLPGSLDKKGGRRFHLSSIFCLIKDGTLFPLPCLMNPALVKIFVRLHLYTFLKDK